MSDEEQGQYLHSEEGDLRSEQLYEHREVTRCQTVKKNFTGHSKDFGFYLKIAGKPMVNCK